MNLRSALALTLSTVSLTLPNPALAQTAATEDATEGVLDQRAQQVLEVLQDKREMETVFGPAFLAAVPPSQFAAINADLIRQYGAPLSVETVDAVGPKAANVGLRFEKAIITVALAVAGDEAGLVEGLRITGVEPVNDSIEKLRADIQALPGQVGVLLAPLQDGEPMLAIDPARELAIGSTFKLYVLSALARSIADGERDWSDVVSLDTKSFPSGQLQNWPDGAPVTLHTLASLMISISDNTATDQLMKVVGRDAVEAELRASGHANPDRSIPMLTTLELFGFKGDLARGEAYAAANEAEQRRLLDAFAQEIAGRPDRIVPPTFSEPTAIDTLEWFASAQDLRRLLARIARLDDPTARQIMAINPVVPADPARGLAYVGYKGGSEPGVVNMTFLLRDDEQEWHVLSLGWNNPEGAAPPATLKPLAERAAALLR